MVTDDVDFDGYFAARWPRLVRSAVLLGCRIDSAEDLVQSAMLDCYRSWGRVCRARDIDAYVFRVLVNRHRRRQRRLWHREDPGGLDLRQQPGREQAELTAADDRLDLVAKLQTLPAAQKEVLVLRFIADLSEAQAAEVLAVPIGTVKSRTARALATLQSRVSQGNHIQEGAGHE